MRGWDFAAEVAADHSLAEWFGEDEIPRACEVCDSGDPVFTVTGSWDEVLGICRTCALGEMVERWLLGATP